ncbi:hypothetical protein FB451DRAFT_1185012 [Mycena latifolia]|nr:hypothetical protein FB451DRAFT_1191945 [Mycena latifolia]KAJ7454261.1 hypothetical protein FB451DRAFT_1185012 [Mycena latifolia]
MFLGKFKIIGSNELSLNAIKVTRFHENKRSNEVTKMATTPKFSLMVCRRLLMAGVNVAMQIQIVLNNQGSPLSILFLSVLTMHLRNQNECHAENEASDDGEAAPEAGTRPVWVDNSIYGAVNNILIYTDGDSPGDKGGFDSNNGRIYDDPGKTAIGVKFEAESTWCRKTRRKQVEATAGGLVESRELVHEVECEASGAGLGRAWGGVECEGRHSVGQLSMSVVRFG